MPPIILADPSGRYLSFAEREEIALLRIQDLGVREIGRRLGRPASTISRELRSNVATRGGSLEYRASVVQWKAERQARRPKKAKLAEDPRLHAYVQDRLVGQVAVPGGAPVPGPDVAWTGRRQDRRWSTAWSPEQIAGRLPIDFPDDGSMRISHEAIYQALYVQGRGALRRGCRRGWQAGWATGEACPRLSLAPIPQQLGRRGRRRDQLPLASHGVVQTEQVRAPRPPAPEGWLPGAEGARLERCRRTRGPVGMLELVGLRLRSIGRSSGR